MARTNIELDDELIKQGLKATKLKTRKELVHYALKELIRRKKRKGLLEFEGKVIWEGSLDRMRRSRV
ncbi:MAG: type II toxin-antitoxin system VapB family antitoxin [bacterium]